MTVLGRLAVIAAGTVYVLGLSAVWLWIDWPVAVAAGILGPAIAWVVSLEAVDDDEAVRAEMLGRWQESRSRVFPRQKRRAA